MDRFICRKLKQTYLLPVLLLFLIPSAYGQNKDRTDTLYFHLPNVIVTAIESKMPGSISLLPSSAIEHIQPASAADLMQLLPGGLTGNSGFGEARYFMVREIAFYDGNDRVSATAAEGMQIVMDGSPLHRNTNIGSPYSGNDTRFLSMNEVEQVEVVRGIPSAQYGNLTNGLLKIKTRTGETPLTFGIRYNPNLKQYTAGKGFRLSPQGHTLNLLADYSTQGYFHVGGIRLANAYRWMPGGKPILLNISYTARTGRENISVDDDSRSRKKYQEHRLTLGSEWKPARRLLESLSLRIDLSAIKSSQTDDMVKRGNIQTTTSATNSGEWLGEILPSGYYYRTRTTNLPLYAEAEVIASTHLPLRTDGMVELKAGINWRSEGNRGDGLQFNLLLPPDYSTRPRSYKDIPFLHNASAFTETFFQWPGLTIRAGIRYQGLISSGYTFIGSVEPRLNMVWTVFTLPAYSFRLKAGTGMMGYMPTTDRLYPAPVYHDRTSFYYNDTETGHSLAVVSTHAPDEIKNPDLRPTINRKAEIGFILETPVVNLDVTAFYERQTGGFATITDYIPFSYRKYTQLTATGLNPEYLNGQVWSNGEALPYTKQTAFTAVSLPVNANLIRKQGIEFVADFGTFQPLRTSFILDGAWLRIRNNSTLLTARTIASDVNGQPYPYIGFYDKQYENPGNQTINSQLTTNFRFITRIPRIGLVTTLTWQMVWMYRNLTRYNGKTDEEVWPLYWSGTDGIRHPFTETEKEAPEFALLKQTTHATSFLQNRYKPYGLFNLRVSKEFTRYATLSFFVNNLGDMKPSRYKRTSSSYREQNPDPFFGLEMQIKL